jgi:hypothetical protein
VASILLLLRVAVAETCGGEGDFEAAVGAADSDVWMSKVLPGMERSISSRRLAVVTVVNEAG